MSDSRPETDSILARFFSARRAAQRLSIDQLVDGTSADAQALKWSAISQLARRLREEGDSIAPSNAGPGDGSSLRVDPSDLPEIEGYELIDIVGRGGMGVVYEAYQRATGRRVAVKSMLASATHGEAVRRRFEREVELIGRLQHPSIVSLIDSGVHRGRYFYVMEFVDGEPLDRWWRTADREGSGGTVALRELLELLAEIAATVDYAHQRGVLHRDLKPSNILIDGDGRPHVLDFGLAKAMDPASGRWLDETLSAPGQLLGTLAYMAPEQARGRSDLVSVRSDVYSLGAILYDLLTGGLPVSTDGPLHEVLQRIQEHDPPPPSARRRGLPVDLDAVALKALDRDPARRYATAGELAADLRRFLRDEPVQARPASLFYEIAKFARRRRGLVIASVIVAVSLIAGIVTTSWQAYRAIVAERLAVLRANAAVTALARSEALADYAIEVMELLTVGAMHRANDPGFGEEVMAAAERAGARFPEDADLRAGLHSLAACAFQSLQKFDDSEVHLRRALALRAEAFGESDPRTLETRMHVGVAADAQWNYVEAERMFREVIARSEPGSRSRLWARGLLAQLLGKMLRHDEAEQVAREGVAESQMADDSYEMMGLRGMLGILLRDSGKLGEAHAVMAELLRDAERIAPNKISTLLAAHRLAGVCDMLDDRAAAVAAWRRVVELAEQLMPAGDFRIMIHTGGLCTALMRAGEYAEAEQRVRPIHARFLEDFGVEHAWTDWSSRLLVEVLEAQGKNQEADAVRPAR